MERSDAILLDIDHSPDALLDPRSTNFYQPDGLRALTTHLKPGGLFGLWSNDRPDPAFTDRLAGVFAEAWAEAVAFDNPLQGRRSRRRSIWHAATASDATEAGCSGPQDPRTGTTERDSSSSIPVFRRPGAGRDDSYCIVHLRRPV